MNGFCPLASGSKGNSIYVGTDKTKLLFDCGVSFKQLKERLEKISVDIKEIEGVIISHEHIDHIRAVDMITKETDIPIICNSDTAKAIAQNTKRRPRFKIFATGEPFSFRDITIHPFSVQHDCVDPVGFTITTSDIKIGLCTDLGFATRLVIEHLKDCNILYLESNHDEELVHACSRPQTYKTRVLSRQGHLSNSAATKVLKEVYHSDLNHLYLAHLSEECNNPIIARETFLNYCQEEITNLKLHIAHQTTISTPTIIPSLSSL